MTKTYTPYNLLTLNRLKVAVAQHGSVLKGCDAIGASRQAVYKWLRQEDRIHLRRLAAASRAKRAAEYVRKRSHEEFLQEVTDHMSGTLIPTTGGIDLGHYVVYKGEIMQVVCRQDSPHYGLKPLKPICCKKCGTPAADQLIWINPDFPLYSNKLEPVPTFTK